MSSDRQRLLAFAALLVAASVWGSSFLIIQETMVHDIWWMLVFRHLFGALGAFFIFRQRALPIRWSDCGLYFKIAFFIVLTFAPQAIGLQGTSVANSAVITALFVVLTPMVLYLMKRGRPTPYQWGGALVGILAFFILGYSQGFSSLSIWDFMTFLTALAVAFHTVYFGEALHPPRRLGAVVFYQFLFSALILLMIAAFFSWNRGQFFESEFTARQWLGLAYLGFFSMAVPYSLQAYSQSILGPIQTVLVISSEPLWAMAIANVFRGDPFTGAAVFASGLLILANLIAEWKPRRKG